VQCSKNAQVYCERWADLSKFHPFSEPVQRGKAAAQVRCALLWPFVAPAIIIERTALALGPFGA
jgi:hypothetical protein